MSKGPWKDDRERRYSFLGVRLTTESRQALRRAAERAGVSDSELARRGIAAVTAIIGGQDPAPAQGAQR